MESKKLSSYDNPEMNRSRQSSQAMRLDISDHRSSNQSFKTDVPRKPIEQRMGSKQTSIPKLPTIKSPLHKYDVKTTELEGEKKLNLDQHSLKHLEFLNMFEERLKNLSKRSWASGCFDAPIHWSILYVYLIAIIILKWSDTASTNPHPKTCLSSKSSPSSLSKFWSPIPN